MTDRDDTDRCAGGDGAETKRARVRRILFDQLGFRSRRGVDMEEERRFLDGLADELAYMSDANLRVLAQMMAIKGEGSSRNIWPDRATFRGYAHVVQPRPMEELPELRRWFASVEGRRMQAEGTLVETWEYFQRNRCPPVKPQARAMVLQRAEESRRRLTIIAEKQAAEIPVSADDLDWAHWYRERMDHLDRLVRDAARGSGVAA